MLEALSGSFVEYQGRTEKEAFELIDYKITKNVKQMLSDAMVQNDGRNYDENTKSKKNSYRKSKTNSV